LLRHKPLARTPVIPIGAKKPRSQIHSAAPCTI
jgi:hypothetical protein